MISFIKAYLRFTNNAVFRVPVPKLGSDTQAIIRYPASLDIRRSLSIYDTIHSKHLQCMHSLFPIDRCTKVA